MKRFIKGEYYHFEYHNNNLNYIDSLFPNYDEEAILRFSGFCNPPNKMNSFDLLAWSSKMSSIYNRISSQVEYYHDIDKHVTVKRVPILDLPLYMYLPYHSDLFLDALKGVI